MLEISLPNRQLVLASGRLHNVLKIDDFNDAIIGVSENDKLVYSYELMVEVLAKNDHMTEEDSMDYIDYNVIRSLPYLGDRAPIVVHGLM